MLIERFFDILPNAWKYLDKYGILQRYLEVWDRSYDKIEENLDALRKLRSIDEIPDKHLAKLVQLIGYNIQRERSRNWNRYHSRKAVKRYSYKGTVEALNDIALDYGSEINYVQDNASKLLILSKQGRLSCDDAYLVTEDYWHDGAFVIQLNRTGDTDAVEEALQTNITAGEKWFVEIQRIITGISEDKVFCLQTGGYSFTNAYDGRLGYGRLDNDIFLSFGPSGEDVHQVFPVIWHNFRSRDPGILGEGILGEDMYLTVEPSGSMQKTYVEN